MKKVFFLLIAVLCLVSCRTAAVKDLGDIETVVPVSLGENAVVQTETVDVSSVQEVSIEGTSQEKSSVVPEIATEIDSESDSESDTESNIESNVENDVESDIAEENVISSEDTSSEVLESNETLETVENDVQVDTEDTISISDEPVQDVPVMQVSTTSSPSSSPSGDLNVSMQEERVSYVYKPEKESFFYSLLAFVKKEPVFSVGVLSVLVGVILLIIALIKAIVRSCKSNKVDDDTKDKKDEEDEERKDDGTLDDDEFLRSLLNS